MAEDKSETTTSIIEEMRKGHTCNLPFAYMTCDGTPAVVDPIAREVEEPIFCLRKVTVGELADRLEQAIKRELGNVAAMREACAKCIELADTIWLSGGGEDVSAEISEMKDILGAALSAPPRQCDVGSQEGQVKRFEAFCNAHFVPNNYGGSCRKCPLVHKRGISCQLAWAQMAYTEKGDRDVQK